MVFDMLTAALLGILTEPFLKVMVAVNCRRRHAMCKGGLPLGLQDFGIADGEVLA